MNNHNISEDKMIEIKKDALIHAIKMGVSLLVLSLVISYIIITLVN